MAKSLLIAGLFCVLTSMQVTAAPTTKYGAVKAFLAELAKAHPANAELFTMGTNGGGEAIIGLKVGKGPIRNLVVATHHGNEYGSTEVAKAFASSIAENPIEGQTVFVIPVLNISGYNSRNRYEENRDPNRDYPGPCGTEGPFKLKSTAALARFVDEQRIVASATLHTYYPAAVYPWGLSSRDLSSGNDDLFKRLAELATQDSGYQVGNSTEVIYPADGTFEDYVYWKHGVWSLLFELGYSHSPSETEIIEMQRRNVPGIRRLLENAPKTRAANHAFSGQCDARLKALDRHDE